MKKLIGKVHFIEPGILRGWVLDSNNHNRKLKIELFIDGNKIDERKANKLRKKLLEKGISQDGNCGFNFNIEKLKITNLESSKIHIVIDNNKFLLSKKLTVFNKKNSIKFISKKSNSTLKKKILIIGLAKSGTSILTFILKNSLSHAKIKFEPEGAKGLYNLKLHEDILNKNGSVITKCLFSTNPNNDLSELSHTCRLYDKVIFIIRDPRDNILSSFFYRWNKGHNKPEKLFKATYEKVLKKEANPSQITFESVMKGNENAKTFLERRYAPMSDFVTKESIDNLFILKYEDMVDGNFTKVESFLGFKLKPEVSVPKSLKRVVRSKKYGNWRDWFNEEDVKLYKPIFNPYLNKLGYDITDWQINSTALKLDPTTGSTYMYNLYNGIKSSI